ncbi:hypothetical protein [Streptomyces sp. NPDC088246]|uniref:hypothetical protein n=1 Tax=Streptomyces sp. NPDC088246 TaxID=3365842 RepID=UPI00380E7C07
MDRDNGPEAGVPAVGEPGATPQRELRVPQRLGAWACSRETGQRSPVICTMTAK